jgi:antirestriction protein ArdC
MKNEAKLNSLALVDIAEEMRLNLKVQPGIGYYGYFDRKNNEIAVCTAYEQVLLHELSHAVDQKLGNSDTEDYVGGEIVAELSACFLASIYGKRADMGSTKKYLQEYIKDGKNKAQFACTLFKYLDRVRAIYEFIKDSATYKTMSIISK